MCSFPHCWGWIGIGLLSIFRIFISVLCSEVNFSTRPLSFPLSLALTSEKKCKQPNERGGLTLTKFQQSFLRVAGADLGVHAPSMTFAADLKCSTFWTTCSPGCDLTTLLETKSFAHQLCDIWISGKKEGRKEERETDRERESIFVCVYSLWWRCINMERKKGNHNFYNKNFFFLLPHSRFSKKFEIPLN